MLLLLLSRWTRVHPHSYVVGDNTVPLWLVRKFGCKRVTGYIPAELRSNPHSCATKASTQMADTINIVHDLTRRLHPSWSCQSGIDYFPALSSGDHLVKHGSHCWQDVNIERAGEKPSLPSSGARVTCDDWVCSSKKEQTDTSMCVLSESSLFARLFFVWYGVWFAPEQLDWAKMTKVNRDAHKSSFVFPRHFKPRASWSKELLVKKSLIPWVHCWALAWYQWGCGFHPQHQEENRERKKGEGEGDLCNSCGWELTLYGVLCCHAAPGGSCFNFQ